MCEYIITEDFQWTSTFTVIKMVCDMNCKEIIIFLVLSSQPKKNSLSVCGDSGICGISKNTARF